MTKTDAGDGGGGGQEQGDGTGRPLSGGLRRRWGGLLVRGRGRTRAGIPHTCDIGSGRGKKVRVSCRCGRCGDMSRGWKKQHRTMRVTASQEAVYQESKELGSRPLISARCNARGQPYRV